MANSKREHEFDVVIAQTIYIRTVWNGQRFDPFRANPYREPVVVEDTRTEEQKTQDTKMGMGDLKMALSWMVGASRA